MTKANEAQIMLKRQSIKSLQGELGVKVYALLGSLNPSEINPIYEEYKVKIDALESEIAAKMAENAAMKA
jgi:hypothetical protein